MCVHLGTRVICAAVLISPAVFAGSPSQAQSLTDALAGPAKNAAAAADWTTITQPDPKSAAKFDHWQAKITFARPSLKKPNPALAASEPPFGLHGPVEEGMTAVPAKPPHGMKGLASFYWRGKQTATGEAFNPDDLTAAHRTLPFGTRVRVTRVDTGDSVIVRINDRGPFKPGRVIDLSRRAAEDLNMTDKGLTAVKLEVLNRENERPIVETVAQRSLGR